MNANFHTLFRIMSIIVLYMGGGTFMHAILDKKLNFRRIAAFGISLGIYNSIIETTILHDMTYIKLSLVFPMIVILSRFILGFNYFESTIGAILTSIITALGQFLLIVFLRIFLGETFNKGSFQSSINIIILERLILTVFFVFISIHIIFNGMKAIIPKGIGKRQRGQIAFNLLGSLLFIIPNIYIIQVSMDSIPTEVIVLNMIAVSVLVYRAIVLSFKSSELEVKKKEAEHQKVHISTMNEIIDGLKGFKHDFNNLLQVVGGYLALNDLEGLKNFYKQVQKDAAIINNKIPINNYLTDVPALYGLILYKLTYAEEKNVNFSVNILSPVNLGNIRIYDISKVLGILLNNAIEAAAESEKRYVELCIREVPFVKKLIIDVRNTYYGSLNTDEIFEKGFTTKKGHNGFGLWDVQKVISKYKTCFLHTLAGKDFFIQTLEIYYTINDRIETDEFRRRTS